VTDENYQAKLDRFIELKEAEEAKSVMKTHN
jgi:hypothetical protein